MMLEQMPTAAFVLIAGASYLGFSTALISFNKILMEEGMFPYPAALGFAHNAFCTIVAGILYVLKPSLFPSLTSENKVEIDARLVRRAIVPISVFFVIQIILSNTALFYANPAFLQMLKKANVIFLYSLAVLFALESFTWRKTQVIICIMLSTWLTIQGELSFAWMGLVLQLSCCLLESIKVCMSKMLLSGIGLDAMSYMLLISPVSMLIFAPVLGAATQLPQQTILAVPYTSDWFRMRWYLLFSCCLAFGLNLFMMLFLKCCSPVSFMLTNIIKDVAIVFIGIAFMGHHLGAMQAIGFALQLILVFIWSMMKQFPQEFDDGMLNGLLFVFAGARKQQEKAESYGSTWTADEDAPSKTPAPAAEAMLPGTAPESKV